MPFRSRPIGELFKSPAQRKRIHKLWVFIGWSLLTGTVIAFINRSFSIPDQWAVLAAGLTPFVIVAIALAGLVAVLSKSRPLQLASICLFAVYMMIAWPVDAIVGCRSEPADKDAGTELTVVMHNVLSNGADSEAVEALVEKTNPDVFMMAEASGVLLRELSANLEEAYPYQSNRITGKHKAVIIYSRWPLTNLQFAPLEGNTYSATVETPGGDVTVIAVHLLAPISNFNTKVWQEELRGLTKASQDSPTIMLGDFNATQDHKPFRQLLKTGWTDVHNEKGCGIDNTWPTMYERGKSWPFPVLRLDHVLITDHFTTLSVDIHRVEGSDHAALETRLQLNE